MTADRAAGAFARRDCRGCCDGSYAGSPGPAPGHSGSRPLAASVAGAALLYVVMIYLVLPWANPLMCHMTPRGPFFIGHLIYGLIFGLVAYPLARRAAPSGT